MATTRILSSAATPRRGSSHAVVAPGLVVWTFRPRVVMAWTGRTVMASGAYVAGGLAMVLGSAIRL